MLAHLTPLDLLARRRGEGLRPALARLLQEPAADADPDRRYRPWNPASLALMSTRDASPLRDAAD